MAKNEGGTWRPSGASMPAWRGEKTPVAEGVPLLPEDSDPRVPPKSEVPENNSGRWGVAGEQRLEPPAHYQSATAMVTLHGTLASKFPFISRASQKANSDLLGFLQRATSTEVGRAVRGQSVKMHALPQSSCSLTPLSVQSLSRVRLFTTP